MNGRQAKIYIDEKLKMALVDVSVSTIIKCPRRIVAEFSGDLSNVMKWYKNIKSVDWKTEPPTTVGSRAAFVAEFLGRRMAYTYEVRELTNESIAMSTVDGPFPMETSYQWDEIDNTTTRMILRNRGEPKGFSLLMAPLMSLMIRRATKKDLAMLKQLLESGVR